VAWGSEGMPQAVASQSKQPVLSGSKVGQVETLSLVSTRPTDTMLSLTIKQRVRRVIPPEFTAHNNDRPTASP
jgi:hypothetical protein